MIPEDFKTNKDFLCAVMDFLLAQQDYHVVSWYWYNRLNSRNTD